MSEEPDSLPFVVEKESDPKKKKAKKRPSDFEIARTILTRTHERKLPFLLKDMGEDPDVLLFCSEKEAGFTYGSPDMSIALFEFTDPDLKAIIDSCLGKLHGLKEDYRSQRIVNVRDQLSELSKTKGESFDVEVAGNEDGSVWTTKTNIKGEEQTVYYSFAIDSLFHMQLVKHWCELYRPLLATDNPAYLYYPYQHTDTNTSSIVSLMHTAPADHPIVALYPHGFRMMVTKGFDVIIDKFLADFPYPIVSEELIVFQNEATACQIAHRLVGEGWRMILLRPNAVFFPTLRVSLPSAGNHQL